MEKLFVLIIILLGIFYMLNAPSLAQGKKNSNIYRNRSIQNVMGSPGFPIPIQPGNMWVYTTREGFKDSVRISSDTLTINNRTYFKLISDGQIEDIYVGLDSSGFYNVYWANYSDTLHYYKKNAKLGDSWTERNPWNPSNTITHTVVDTGSIWMSNILISNAKLIHVTTSGYFIDDSEIWADEFGLVQVSRYDDYTYFLQVCRINGKIFGDTSYLPTDVKNEMHIKKAFALAQNYPNPFNPSTKISYELPARSNVLLKVYNMLGKEVAVLVNAEQNEGLHSVTFNGESLVSGVYFYILRAGNYIQTKKMILLQ